MKHLFTIAAVCAASLALATPASHAEPADSSESTSAAKVPVARRLYDEGLEAAGKKQYAVAYERFKASYELVPRPLTLYNLAGAQAQTGRPVEASESYRKFLRDTADGRFPELRANAQTQLEVVTKQVAQITLDITGLEASDTVTIDDIEFPQSILREAIPLDPGAHTAVVRRGGAALATQSISLTSGANEPVKIEVPAQAGDKPVDLSVHPGQPAGSPAATASVLDTHPAPPPEHHSVWRSPWLWTTVAVVVAGGVTAGILLTRPDNDVLVVR
ncbi:MAG TPA: hypothetical protein VFP84_30485 [Kofleriaceae bacterium]|nr:hypothetical protein [Kofleriaceae bacterium]